jgi:hypothetical protein
MRKTITMHPTIYVPSGTPIEILARIENALMRGLADSSSQAESPEDSRLAHAQHAA